jgi:hypothetical protein
MERRGGKGGKEKMVRLRALNKGTWAESRCLFKGAQK